MMEKHFLPLVHFLCRPSLVEAYLYKSLAAATRCEIDPDLHETSCGNNEATSDVLISGSLVPYWQMLDIYGFELDSSKTHAGFGMGPINIWPLQQ